MECKRYEPKASISEKFLVQLFSKGAKQKEKNENNTRDNKIYRPILHWAATQGYATADLSLGGVWRSQSGDKLALLCAVV